MAPTITSTADYPKEHLSLNHKLRKPIVEKLRRDRINKSIEDLKDLLGQKLLNQQPDSKLEKADILEMTVCLLRRHLHAVKTSPSFDAASQGFSRCAQDVVYFLSEDSGRSQSHGKLLTQFQNQQQPSDDCRSERHQCPSSSPVKCVQDKDNSPAKCAPWRPCNDLKKRQQMMVVSNVCPVSSIDPNIRQQINSPHRIPHNDVMKTQSHATVWRHFKTRKPLYGTWKSQSSQECPLVAIADTCIARLSKWTTLASNKS
ncbi:transcription factor HES-4-B-like [Alosa pseudoharengus]|uniref:transcription factor HES-4-B-like n=1 Tax=Alosa pseudoharengus TaxID=34774 RepID=UPI003F8A4722